MKTVARSRKKRVEAEKEPLTHISFRVETRIISQIETMIAAMSSPWRAATLSDAFRKVILAGLEALKEQTRTEGGSGANTATPPEAK